MFESLPEDLQNQILEEQAVTTFEITKGTAERVKEHLAGREVI